MAFGVKKPKSNFLTPDRANWSRSRTDQRSLYYLSIVPRGITSLFEDLEAVKELRSTLNVPASVSLDFVFEMLQDFTVDTPPAVNIVPTQNGGKYIEHQGNIFNNISLRGTTGLRPNKNVSKFTSIPEDSNSGIPAAEKTGFDTYVELINFFSLYFSIKEDPLLSRDWVMIWKNYREAEFFIVEPTSFRRGRSSMSPVSADFDIALKTINRVEVVSGLPEDPAAKRRTSLLSRIRNNTRELATYYTTVSSLIDSVAAKGTRTITTVLNPVNDILLATAGIVKSGKRVLLVPRSTLSNAFDSMSDLHEELESFNVVYKNNGIRDNVAWVMRNLRRMQANLSALYSIDSLFEEEYGGKKNRKRNAYNNSPSQSGGENADFFNDFSGDSVSESTVGGDESIRDICKRLLGDGSKWKSLVVLNGLKFPYIADDGDGEVVLKPGDKILYPARSTSRNSAMIAADTSAEDKQTLESRLGRDLRAEKISSEGVEGNYTLKINRRGDLATVEGVDNMIQAVTLKFLVQKGELPKHREYGAGLPTGEKSLSIRGRTAFQISTKALLLSDSRIESVGSVDIAIEGNKTTVKADIKVKEADDIIPVSLSLGR